MVRDVGGRPGVAPWLLAGVCLALVAPAAMQAHAQDAAAPADGTRRVPPTFRRQTVALTPEQQRILESARSTLKHTSLSSAEQQVRLCAVEAAISGTVVGPDDDNPEVQNPKFWTLTEEGYVVAANSTAVEAIDDLWTVHQDDGVPVPRIWCYKYALLIMARAYVQHFHNTHSDAGLAAMNSLIGHNVIPGGVPNGGEGVLWKTRRGNADLLPGDQVWFENPYFARGRELIRQIAYAEAVSDGRSAGQAAAIAEETADNAAAGEQGSNVFFLGENQVARGALSVVRAYCGGFPAAGGQACEQVYARKIFTIPRYQEHMIDDYYTVQACMDAAPGTIHPRDFQIKRVRALVDPGRLLHSASDAGSSRRLDRLIDAMASRNKAPALADCGDERIPLFAADYDWSEQERVRAAILAVMKTKTDAMWWRLRGHCRDTRYALTASLHEAAENVSLGAWCGDLAYADLSRAYARHLPSVAGRLPKGFSPEDVFWKNEREWARAAKPLYQMQIEVCRRALEQWPAAGGTEPGKDGPFRAYTTEEKARFTEAVRKEIEDLKRTKRAVFVDAIVPWVAAPSGWEGFDAQRAKGVREEYARKKATGETARE